MQNNFQGYPQMPEGYLHSNGFYYLNTGGFYDHNGCYFDVNGYDEYGGYYDENCNYIPPSHTNYQQSYDNQSYQYYDYNYTNNSGGVQHEEYEHDEAAEEGYDEEDHQEDLDHHQEIEYKKFLLKEEIEPILQFISKQPDTSEFCIRISNLSYKTTEDDLMQFFNSKKETPVKINRITINSGNAIVYMSDKQSVINSLKMQNEMLMGRAINLTYPEYENISNLENEIPGYDDEEEFDEIRPYDDEDYDIYDEGYYKKPVKGIYVPKSKLVQQEEQQQEGKQKAEEEKKELTQKLGEISLVNESTNQPATITQAESINEIEPESDNMWDRLESVIEKQTVNKPAAKPSKATTNNSQSGKSAHREVSIKK